MPQLISSEKSNWVTLTLNRPDKKNALDLDLVQNLTCAFHKIRQNPSIEGVILRGEGDCFCSGADLNWMMSSSFDSSLLFKLFHTIWACDLPVMAHAFGSVYGGGIGLLSVCDFVSAESQSRFCFSELKWGLSPALISFFVLKKIPFSKARFWMLTGCTFNAPSVENELINCIGSTGQCLKWESQMIQHLKSLDLQAFKKTKSLLRQMPHFNLEEAQKLSIQCLNERRSSLEAQKALSSFLKKELCL